MITIVSAFYIINSKFNISKYKYWIQYFLENSTCNLIIFTNNESKSLFNDYHNNRIKIIICELNEFYNYKYINYWKENHKKNYLLNNIDFELNMLWSEKISFVKKAIHINHFNTEWFCWCDIGYFRPEANGTISKDLLKIWPNKDKIKNLNKDKIYYGLSHNNLNIVKSLSKMINNVDKNGLPKVDIPLNQTSIAGGFFIIHKDKINWWHNMYDNMLLKYFENNKIVKDDQIIIINNIFLNIKSFHIVTEKNNNYDHWFLFQRWLL